LLAGNDEKHQKYRCAVFENMFHHFLTLLIIMYI